ncbi:hypothetical protein VUR80DRAFT_5470 [Thermomyces stellatus]
MATAVLVPTCEVREPFGTPSSGASHYVSRPFRVLFVLLGYPSVEAGRIRLFMPEIIIMTAPRIAGPHVPRLCGGQQACFSSFTGAEPAQGRPPISRLAHQAVGNTTRG